MKPVAVEAQEDTEHDSQPASSTASPVHNKLSSQSYESRTTHSWGGGGWGSPREVPSSTNAEAGTLQASLVGTG